MSTIRATSFDVQMFVKRDGLYTGTDGVLYFDEAKLEPEEKAASEAVIGAARILASLHGNKFRSIASLTYHPLDGDSENAVFVYSNTPGKLPVVRMSATYEDGKSATYILYPGFQDIFTGVNWKAEDLVPYFKALLYRAGNGKPSIVCQLLPFMCNIPAWLWLGAAIYATKEALDNKNRGDTMNLFYTVSALAAWEEFGAKGGLEAIMPTTSTDVNPPQ